MKISALTLVFLFIFLSSCQRVLYTHQQEMDKFRTKNDVIKRFGIPESKETSGEYEQWIFKYGTTSSSSTYSTPYNSNTQIRKNQDGVELNTYSNPRFNYNYTNTSNNYVRFVFKNDYVVSYETRGVDLTVTEPNRTGNWILFLSFVGLLTFAMVMGLSV